MRHRIVSSAVAIILGVCSASQPAPLPHVQLGEWGVDLKAIDARIRPGDDFFMFVNGAWYKTTEIPANRSNIGLFQNLGILSERRLLEIADTLAAKPYLQLSADEKRLRDLYDAFIDQRQIDSRGLTPAEPDLDYLRKLKTHEDVAWAMGVPRLKSDSIFGIAIGLSEDGPARYVVSLSQSGLGLPNRDFYLRTDEATARPRDAYRKYLADMLRIAGMDHADVRAGAVFDLERQIAGAQWSNADRRDAGRTYNPMSVSELKKLAPQFPWDKFLAARRIPLASPSGERQVVVVEKSAFPKLAEVFAATPVAVWRDYLTIHYLHVWSDYLPTKVADADFAFYGGSLLGNVQQLPRNIRATQLLDDVLGESIGRIYVARYFPPASKANVQLLVANVLKAYDSSIQTLEWMTPTTRRKALEKLHRIGVKIGYPDTWRDYSGYVVKRDDLIGNVRRGTEFEWNRRLERLDKPVERAEWRMTPQTANAYYDRRFNEIVFPAGFLEAPMFDPLADAAVNYGAVGAFVGHEISHAFDDQGSKYGPDGSLQNWWMDVDRENFDERAERLGRQYDTYEPLPGLHVDSRFTMGENIADVAGIDIALKAYKAALSGKPAPILNGYTGEQRFCLSFAQVRRSKFREGAMRQRVLSDSHSPPQFRAIGATRNLDSWYTAFNVQPGDKYYLSPDQRVHLW
jgi:predicted metalloendopeptidase